MSEATHSFKRLEQIVEPLLLWYQVNKRTLPWRENPSPYHVWVSEIMLQQTRVEAVKPYFERFVRELPDVRALAQCPEQRLLKLWEGLGYYSRVRNLQKCAQQLMLQYDGQLPADYELLKKLPGIGDYTAGAIASIAFDLPVPAVDGNVLRVLTRLLACADDITQSKTKEKFRTLLLEIEPHTYAGDFNQALMELGATVCLPNAAPQCLLCPIQSLCLAHEQNREIDYPVKTPKKARRIEHRTLFLFSCEIDGKQYTLLHRRPKTGVLKNMWEFPAQETCCTPDEAFSEACKLSEQLGLFAIQVTPAAPAKHIFTHIEWHMTAWKVSAVGSDIDALSQNLPDDFLLVESQDLAPDNPTSTVALPSAFKAYRQLF